MIARLVLSLLLLLAGCGSSQFLSADRDRLRLLSPEELHATEFFCSSSVEFVSLRQGEIVGEDIFKHEVKRTLAIGAEEPGKLIDGGPDWITVGWENGVVLNFTWDPVERQFQTPGWGTITVAGERFDLRQGVLAGRMIRLLVRNPG
jgi:hypothetical protein